MADRFALAREVGPSEHLAAMLSPVRAARCALLAGVTALALGCGAPRVVRDTTTAARCARTLRTNGAAHRDVERVARAGGLTELLTEPAGHDRLLQRLLLVRAELDAAEAEVDCLGDDLEEIEVALVERQRDVEWAFTFGSIAVGALAAVGAGAAEIATNDDVVGAAIGIGGGVVSAVLGAVALFPPGAQVELRHDRNVLRTFTGPGRAEDALPSFVMRLAELPRASDASTASEVLLARFDAAIEESSDPARLRALLLGDGGTYDLEALRLREALLDVLETEVALMSQDLELLLRSLE